MTAANNTVGSLFLFVTLSLTYSLITEPCSLNATNSETPRDTKSPFSVSLSIGKSTARINNIGRDQKGVEEEEQEVEK